LPRMRFLRTKRSLEREHAQRRLTDLVNELIAKRVGDDDAMSEDFIALLLRESRTSSPTDGQQLTQVRDEVMTMLIAANHTITAAAEWMFKAVSENEGVLHAIQDELDVVL